jgi:hypothetical protein
MTGIKQSIKLLARQIAELDRLAELVVSVASPTRRRPSQIKASQDRTRAGGHS